MALVLCVLLLLSLFVENEKRTKKKERVEFWSHCLLGYLVDYRLLRAYNVNRILEDHWATRGRVKVRRMGDLYIIHFDDLRDMHDVLERSIIVVDGAMMVLKKWEPALVPRTVTFPTVRVWVRVYGLPFEYLNMHVANIVAKLFGNDTVIEEFDTIPDHDFLRMRVTIRLGCPLNPGFFLACCANKLLWIQFKYEELFKYCTRCGRIGHKSGQCIEDIQEVVDSINNSLELAINRGFAVFQTRYQFTMFHLNLCAFPSTTRFVTSRVRLGEHR
ncbi:uncharacterized protein LOC141588371 [Silene latifolia]|uniref:uncharacterized protein LOC141588371 n=1 Tax=Silene latifolia TaxID=37657 RepID=UPI003D785827